MLRVDVKYYFADFVRIGSTQPFREKNCQKKLRAGGGPPPPLYRQKMTGGTPEVRSDKNLT